MSIVIGVITIALGIAGMIMKWGDVSGFERFVGALIAVVPVLFIVSGLIAIVAGISGIKDRVTEKSAVSSESAEKAGEES